MITAVIGAGSLMAFMLFLYAGAWTVVPLGMSEMKRLLLDILISLVFFFQHSGMIRRSFRHRLNPLIPSQYQGALYTIASGFILLASITFWQRTDTMLFEAQGVPAIVMRVFYLLSVLGMCWGMGALHSIDMFGLDPILKIRRPIPSPATILTIRGPYRWVRHPLYLFMIVLFWSCPSLTADRLLFNALWTIWIIIGTILEERDLISDFGDAYREYQAMVPMLIPHGILPAYTADKSDKKAEYSVLR